MKGQECRRPVASENAGQFEGRSLTGSSIQTLPGMLLLGLLLTSSPVSVVAQNIDDCMEADPDDAIEICQGILDSGSRNADVYWTLASALFQQGDSNAADKVLDKARSLYPGNRKLQRLDVLINSNLDESQLLEQAARKNDDSLRLGMLKITCRTKDTLESLEACRRYLDITDSDDEQINSRLAWLEDRHGDPLAPPPAGEDGNLATSGDGTSPNSPQGAPVERVAELDEPGVDVRESAPDITATQPVPERTATTDTPARLAFRRRVTALQTGLNALGFDAGQADGVPGELTRQALARFYESTSHPPREDFSEQTLNDVLIERRLRASAAREKHSESTLASARVQTQSDPATRQEQERPQAQQTPKVLQQTEQADNGLVMLESTGQASGGSAEAGKRQQVENANRLARVMSELDRLEVELAFELRQYDDHLSELRHAADRAIRLVDTTVQTH